MNRKGDYLYPWFLELTDQDLKKHLYVKTDSITAITPWVDDDGTETTFVYMTDGYHSVQVSETPEEIIELMTKPQPWKRKDVSSKV